MMADIPVDATNRQILFAAIPNGMPKVSDFEQVTVPVPRPKEGQFLVRHLFIGLSPSARLRMAGPSAYSSGFTLGKTVQGQAVGMIVSSQHPEYAVGEYVVVNGGWQDYSLSSGRDVVRIDPAVAPVSTALGMFGTSGMTAYVGLLDIGQPKAGDTVVISAASGSVGSMVGQIARIQGCRVVGIAGGAEKCAYVINELGFDACVDHRGKDFPSALAGACPSGVDISFENVGGAVRDAVWPLLNEFARVVLCGMIAEYQNVESAPGPNWYPILTRRLTIKGFLLRDHAERRDVFTRTVGRWYQEGKLRYREDITVGLDQTPQAFIRLLQGNNFGKSIVRLTNE
jgi:NADPH-dependent curcumin reductase CurA